MTTRTTPPDTAQQPLRTVLFVTGTSTRDIPVAPDFPTALLPLGSSTFLERVLAQLSNAGVRHLDLVVSSRPEDLRRLLGDGERWGLRLRWHLVKNGNAPYGILRSLGLDQNQHILLGHADRWIADEVLASLVHSDLVLTRSDDGGVHWAGWSSTRPERLAGVSQHSDERSLGALMCSLGDEVRVLEPSQFIQASDARCLLAAQSCALEGKLMAQAPATWLRKPWGAHSPDAVVQPGALIDGPVLIGPGCIVSSGAQIGPGTVLTHDIVISSHSSVRHSLVLPHTYIGEGLELDNTIVNGRSVQHLSLGVRTVLPISEGLLMDLKHTRVAQTGALARAMAVLLCLLFSPWLVLDTVLRRLRGLPLRWQKRPVVVGHDADGEQLLLQQLRCANTPEWGGDSLLAQFGSWLDVVQGRRSWFGARPRSPSEWYALSRDWQVLLTNTAVGCFHARAWSDSDGESADARAAADVFFAVRQSASERLRLLLAVLRGA